MNDVRSTLGGFILAEMQKRNMSARAFAELIGVDHSQVNKFLNHGIKESYAGRAVGDPSLDFLAKLSQATGVSVYTLIGLVMPNLADVNVDAEARALADQIRRLPPESRRLIDAFIYAALMQNRREDS